MTMFKTETPLFEGVYAPVAQSGAFEHGDCRPSFEEHLVQRAEAACGVNGSELQLPTYEDDAAREAMNLRIDNILRNVKIAAGNRVA